jgi:tripartite ATP-independent transporter DctM subunit
MGEFSFNAGISRDLFFTVHKWLGRFKGGLAMATVGGCAGFAAVCGSSMATAATMGTVALAEMKRYKYDDALATGCVAAGGTMGIMIPPSIGLAIYGILTEQSIGKLFLAGFIPGLLEAISYIVTISIICTINPEAGPRGPATTFVEKIASLKGTWSVFLLFIVVIGGIYIGIFSPTEAAAVGAFGALLIAFARRRLGFSEFRNSLFGSIKIVAMLYFIVMGALIFGYFLSATRLPFELSTIISNLSVNRYIILAIIILVYIFLGCVMESMAIVLITVPILFPLIMNLGFDPIWFGVVLVRTTEVGLISPPVGMNVFIIKGIAEDVKMYTIFRGIVPFLFADLINIVILVTIPELVLFLPNLMK